MLHLVFDASETLAADAAGPWIDAVVLRPGLLLLDSEATRSELYHAVKHHLPPGTALLVAPLSAPPKMKGMTQGSTTWLRQRS